MNSQYIQQASLNPVKGKGSNVLFTNLSSQQQNPGKLNEWYDEQNHAMQPMPFTQEENTQENPGLFGQWFDVSATNLSLTNKIEIIGQFFDANVRSTKADFITPSQRAWAVPVSQLELRETDMF